MDKRLKKAIEELELIQRPLTDSGSMSLPYGDGHASKAWEAKYPIYIKEEAKKRARKG